MNNHEKIQNNWQNLKLVYYDAIVYGDGKITLGNTYYTKDSETDEIQYYWNPICDTDLESIEKYDDDCWVDVDIYKSKAIYGSNKIVCGEGTMGNEGFVACIDQDDKLIWSIFFDFSNPINKVEVINDSLICYGDTGVIIYIDLNALHKITIKYDFY